MICFRFVALVTIFEGSVSSRAPYHWVISHSRAKMLIGPGITTESQSCKTLSPLCASSNLPIHPASSSTLILCFTWVLFLILTFFSIHVLIFYFNISVVNLRVLREKESPPGIVLWRSVLNIWTLLLSHTSSFSIFFFFLLFSIPYFFFFYPLPPFWLMTNLFIFRLFLF